MKQITSRDREIIKYVTKYGYITIAQAYQIWFNDCNYGYDIARKRLTACVENGYLRTTRDFYGATTENIYFIEKDFSTISRHMLLIMDVYAKISKIGGDIKYFKREQNWCERAYRSDAFVIYTFEGFLYSLCVEVLDKGTSTRQNHEITVNNLTRKYNSVINSEGYKEIGKKLNIPEEALDCLKPDLLIIDNITEQRDWNIVGKNLKNKVFHLDFEMKNICKILI